MRISFLVMDATALGGTVRAVVQLANELAARHDVEIVSVFDTRPEPFFEPATGVRLRVLDRRVGVAPADRAHVAGGPSRYIMATDRKYDMFSARTDQLLEEALAAIDADVLVSTRSSLSIAAAQLTTSTPVVAQEHVPVALYPRRTRWSIRRHYRRLAAVSTLTAADAADVTRLLGTGAPPVVQIPNGLPAGARPVSDQSGRIVVAAGRLAEVKRYDLLIDAFAEVARQRPDWQLRIYGAGPERARLRARVEALQLYNSVFLMGSTNALETELAKASLAAVSSRSEGFGMTIIEAMSAGVPVVSVDCPYGPGEIITSGVDGVLVPDGDGAALAEPLLDLIDDAATRRRLATEARKTAEKYDLRIVARRWEDLLTQVVGRG